MTLRFPALVLAAGLATPLAAQDAGDSLDALADRLGLGQDPAPAVVPAPAPAETPGPAAPSTAAPAPVTDAPNLSEPATGERSTVHALSERTRAWLDAHGNTPPPPSGRPDPDAFDTLFPLTGTDAASRNTPNHQTDPCNPDTENN